MGAIYKREIRAYLCNMYAAIYATVFLAFTGVFVYIINLYGEGTGGYSNLEYALSQLILVLLFILPILAMRSVSEDNRNRTNRFYLPLPLRPMAVVAGKYLALLTVYTLPLIPVCLYPLLFSAFATTAVNFAATYCFLFAFWLMGAALLAVCMFISALTENQIVAAVLCIVVTLALYFLDSLAIIMPDSALASFIAFAVLAVLFALVAYGFTKSLNLTLIAAAVLIIPLSVVYIITPSSFAGLFPALLAELGLFSRLSNFMYGLFDLSAIVLYLSVAFFFVFLTAQSLDRKRWQS